MGAGWGGWGGWGGLLTVWERGAPWAPHRAPAAACFRLPPLGSHRWHPLLLHPRASLPSPPSLSTPTRSVCAALRMGRGRTRAAGAGVRRQGICLTRGWIPHRGGGAAAGLPAGHDARAGPPPAVRVRRLCRALRCGVPQCGCGVVGPGCGQGMLGHGVGRSQCTAAEMGPASLCAAA